MTATTLKRELHKAIDEVNDNVILEAVYAILNKSIEISHRTIQPFSLDEFYARNAQSQKEIKKGKLIGQSEIKKRFSSK